jgi:hypothetical protein
MNQQIEDIFADLISAKALPNTSAVILRNKDRVIASFKAVLDRYNYRALKHAFRDFEYFYKQIDSGFMAKEQFADDLCRAFIAIGYEVQLATISTDKEWSATSSMVRYMGKQHSPEIELTDFDKLLDRHELEWDDLWSSRSAIFSPELWQKIFKNERVEREVLSAQIKAIPYFSSEEQEDWVRLYHWNSLDDDQAELLIESVLEGIKENKYTSCEVIMHVFSILMRLVNEGAVESSLYASCDAVESAAKEYLDALVARHELGFSRKYRGMYWDKNHSENGLQYCGLDSYSKSLVSMIDNAVDKTLESETVESVDVWLGELKKGNGEFFDCATFAEGKYRLEPVFKYFVPSEFFEAFLAMPNSKKYSAINGLNRRYGGKVDMFAEELPFWTELCQFIKEKNSIRSGLITPSAKCLTSAEIVFSNIVKLLTSDDPKAPSSIEDEVEGE